MKAKSHSVPKSVHIKRLSEFARLVVKTVQTRGLNKSIYGPAKILHALASTKGPLSKAIIII